MTNKEAITARKEEEKSPLIAVGLPSLLTTLLTAATLLGLCLHLIGDITHAVYLEALGVQPDLFPQSTDAKIIGGYLQVILLGTSLLNLQLLVQALIVWVMLGVYLWIMRRPSKLSELPPLWFHRRSMAAQNIIGSLLISLFTVAFVGAAIVALLSVGSLPLQVGRTAGENKANMMRGQISSMSAERRSELWRGNKREARGHIISANELLIAIYDIDAAATRTLPREGMEIRAAIVPVKVGSAGNAALP